jgi:two-component system sensor histidine kinase/response regulator
MDTHIKVLLIEDDEDDYLITRDVLSEIAQTTVDLEWVSRCEDALPAIQRGTNDVVLLDYRLGECTGLDILREAMARGCKTPVILLTGQGDREVDVEAMKAGAADYLIKGRIDAALIERSMRYAMERSQAAELRERQLAAEASIRARNEFLAIVTHELRSPLSVILGYADMLLDGDPPPEQRELLEPIRRSSCHLRALVNDILDFSKIEAHKLKVEHVPCSPGEVIHEVASMMEANAAEAGVEIATAKSADVAETIYTDPTRLRQILLNLVGNAIKFTKRGTVSLTARMAEPTESGTRPVCFDVRDSGIGLSDEEVRRLFEPFVQAGDSTARRFGGTGLGLAISKRLAGLLGGDIKVESQPSAGSTFTLTIAGAPPAA